MPSATAVFAQQALHKHQQHLLSAVLCPCCRLCSSPRGFAASLKLLAALRAPGISSNVRLCSWSPSFAAFLKIIDADVCNKQGALLEIADEGNFLLMSACSSRLACCWGLTQLQCLVCQSDCSHATDAGGTFPLFCFLCQIINCYGEVKEEKHTPTSASHITAVHTYVCLTK